MFSKSAYLGYFSQIEKVENAMAAKFLEYSGLVDDPALKQFFLKLHRQERSHVKVAAQLTALMESLKDEKGTEGKK